MNYYSLFYWLTVGDKLSLLFAWMCFFSTAFFIIFNWVVLFNSEDAEETYYKKCSKFAYFTWFWLPLSWFLYIGTPTKKEALLIIGGGAIGNFITQDSSARQLPSDLVNFLRVQIKDATKNAFDELTTKNVEDMTKEELLEYIKKQNK